MSKIIYQIVVDHDDLAALVNLKNLAVPLDFKTAIIKKAKSEGINLQEKKGKEKKYWFAQACDNLDKSELKIMSWEENPGNVKKDLKRVLHVMCEFRKLREIIYFMENTLKLIKTKTYKLSKQSVSKFEEGIYKNLGRILSGNQNRFRKKNSDELYKFIPDDREDLIVSEQFYIAYDMKY